MTCKRKTKQNRKKYGVCYTKKYGVCYFYCVKNGMCTGKKKAKKVNMQKTNRITKYYNSQYVVLDM